MELLTVLPDAPPEERLSLYRLRGIDYGTLMVPFDSLSRLQRQAALLLAAEWGRELAEVEGARADIAHNEDPTGALAGLWLVRILDGPVHPADGEYWAGEAQRWRGGEGTDPRLAAFRDAWREAVDALGPPPPPGPKCRCHACKEKYAARRRKHR